MNLVRQILVGSAPDGFALYKKDLAEPWIIEYSPPMDRMGFVLVLRGHVIVTSHEEDRPMSLFEGDLMFIPRAMDHRFAVTPSADTIDHNCLGSPHRGPRFSTQRPVTLACGGFRFVAAPVHPVLAKLPWCVILRRQDIAKYPSLEQVVRLICTELESSDAPSQDTQLLLLEALFHYVFMSWAKRESQSEYWRAIAQDPRLVHVLSLLCAEPAKWSVDALASECGLSRSTFRSLFTATVGESPGRYLSRLRVEQAKELLKSTSLSLTAIAERVGYADPFSLSKAFKRFEGCSPREYRQPTARPQGTLRNRRRSRTT